MTQLWSGKQWTHGISTFFCCRNHHFSTASNGDFCLETKIRNPYIVNIMKCVSHLIEHSTIMISLEFKTDFKYACGQAHAITFHLI